MTITLFAAVQVAAAVVAVVGVCLTITGTALTDTSVALSYGVCDPADPAFI